MAGFYFEYLINNPAMLIDLTGPFKKYVGKEDDFQKSVAKYLDNVQATWFHCPNGGSRNAIEATKLKAMGTKPGVPDCLILDQLKGFSGLAIELKVGYNKPSEQQLAFLDKLVAQNWLVIVSWSLDEIITVLDWYYNINQKNEDKSERLLGE
jgi:hypothetical protein